MIKILSNETIQKIAAGEVIERPSSIVKELVENSIDAGASKIIVEIKNGGIEYISVTDNGSGIKEEEVDLAFMRHATSKLDRFNDLYNLDSLGFRGEALASIVAVSKLSISTRTADDKIGIKIDYINGKRTGSRPIAKNIGTNIIIEDLFYNVPVRKKFLKSNITEANNITNLMYKLAVGNFNVGFSYIKDDKLIFETKENENLESTLTELFGFETFKNMLKVDIKNREFSITGFISNNKNYRANRSLQYLYVNGRYVENKEIRQSIENSYKSLIPNGRYPIYQLFLNIKPQFIDVNIHPNKEKVQITIIENIVDDLKNITRDLLNSQFSIHSITTQEDKIERKNILFNDDNSIKDLLEKFDNKNKDSLNVESNVFEDSTVEKENIDFEYIESENIAEDREEYSIKIEQVESNSPIEELDVEEVSFFNVEDLRKYNYIGTIFKTYIIYEDLENNKIILIDQHAAHERILYEKYLKEFKEENTIVQPLIQPITVELRDDEIQMYQKNKALFLRLGYEIDRFGDSTLIIREVPVILGIPKNEQFFLDLIDKLSEFNTSEGFDSIYNKIIKMSCKSAVKAGDFLGNIEVEELINKLMKCNEPYTCPHGRPTLIEMTKYELEKEFMRVK